MCVGASGKTSGTGAAFWGGYVWAGLACEVLGTALDVDTLGAVVEAAALEVVAGHG